jgi:hypothetical protein
VDQGVGRRVVRRPAWSLLVAALALTAPAAAHAAPPGSREAAAAPPPVRADLPLQLPEDTIASAAREDLRTWLVGARPGAAGAAVARRFGATHFGVPQTGGYVVARARAGAFAAALKARGLLVYAEANTWDKPLALANDPLSGKPNNWRARVADASLALPPVTAESPLIALVDAAADLTHPEWTGDPFFTTIPGTPVTNPHGTATASVAAAPANGIGILGVWPGARTLNVPLQTLPGTDGGISCEASANGIAKAIMAGAAVINMSYGSISECTSERLQIDFAVGRGIIPVAAAGNEYEEGNPYEFPASLPHVVTVAATDSKGRSADFSNANDSIDLSAPGVDILAAVPPALDDDGTADGYEKLSGTSFAAPMVSAAIAWVRAVRPDLAPDQAAAAVRLSARDVGVEGWDPLTGFGILDVGAALKIPLDRLPIHDPSEPNDNISWVNGQAYAGGPAPVWSGGPAVRVDALLDKEEDPADVYRIVIPPHRSARISAIPVFGDVELDVFSSAAVAITDTAKRTAFSHRLGAHATELVTIVNHGIRQHAFYAAVRPQGKSLFQDRQYRLRVG